MTSSAVAVLAHGIGGRDDLPLPLGWAVTGAAVAVVVSFVALGVLWRTPRWGGGDGVRPLPARLATAPDSRAAGIVAQAAGLLLGLYVLSALAFGSDDTDNPLPWVVYVLLWVGLVPASLVLGPVWRRLDPIRAAHLLLHRALRLDPAEGLRPLPAGLGYWPAAVGLFGFTWLELVAQDNASRSTLRLAIGLYVAVQVLAGMVFGARWYDRGEALEVWSGLFARMSPWTRNADGRWGWRSPLRGLDRLPASPGLVATVMVMLGSTAYDGLSGSTWWTVRVQESALPSVLLRTAGLAGTIAALWLVYVVCTTAAGRIAGTRGVRALPGAFAGSILPVALGYVVAHYYSFFVVEVQRAVIKLSDPWGRGWDVLGTGDLQPSYALVDPSLVVVVQVLAIVAGHVLGVVVAHERAVTLFPRRAAVVGQLPLLVLMVALTCTGLFLLFAS
ncbi:MAG: hypothetical protein U0Q15_17655 [Kineosporiaceae bacterium]